jgi:high-affinity iron transporter
VWSDAVPNLLIGLREGLEAGLIVSILVAAVVRAERRDRLAQVWAGVAGAAALSLSFGAVLTFAAADLSSTTQETISGVLSLVAVGLVTWMVFRMRRTARSLSADLRTRTEAALAVGGSLLFVTAFLAVGREGLEAALFLWSTTRTAGESAGPLLGALVGLLLAAGLCWALYRRSLRINLARFFTWTGAALIVIAAGVVGYGLRDLQEASVLPGLTRSAFDLSGPVDPASWYARTIEGVFNITPAMTRLQVAGYLLYLLPVMTAFVVMSRRAAAPAATPAGQAGPREEAPAGAPPPARGRPRRPWLVVAGLGGVLAAATVAVIVTVGPRSTPNAVAIMVTNKQCAPGWSAPSAGQPTFDISNRSSQVVEVYLMDATGTTAHGEVEGLVPGTSRTMSVGLARGSYLWRCVLPDGHATYSSVQALNGGGQAALAYTPVTTDEMNAAASVYRARVGDMLVTLANDTDALAAAVHEQGSTPATKALWLQAHLDYIRLGAAYGTFGDFDTKINGQPNGLPGGVDDPGFTGFGRLEYELWQAPADANPAVTVDQLDSDIHALGAAFPNEGTDPRDLPLRTHEILENGLQFELTGIDDQGSHTNLATLRADVDATKVVLASIHDPLAARAPELYAHVDSELDTLAATIDQFRTTDGTWRALGALTLAQRQLVNGAVSQMVEDLAPIPDILELPND